MKNHRRTILQYSLPAILTLLVLSTVLGVKQIFPFGSNTIDYYDMGQQVAAYYYHVYDVLHGEKSLFYDWYSALGASMMMNVSGFASISLSSLFLYFFHRDMILEAFSVFTVVKMMCMSVAMYFFLDRRIKTDYFWKLCFSIGYGISGYALMFYTINQWMDIAVICPLLMEGLCRLIKEKKSGMYICFMSLSLIGSYYHGFMLLVFIVLVVGLYFLFISTEERAEKRSVVCVLAMATILSLAVSSFILIPQLVHTLGSARYSNNTGEENFYLSILKQVKGAYLTRWWFLSGLSLPFATICYGMIGDLRKKINKRYVIFFASLIFVVCAELLVESINLMIHFGSYTGYPVRNGFIISFVVLTAACYYTKNLSVTIQVKKKGAYRLIGILFIVMVFGAFLFFYRQNTELSSRQILHLTFFVCIVTFMLYTLLICKKQFSYVIFILLAELLIFSYIHLGKPIYITGYSEGTEQSSAYISATNELVDDLEIESSVTKRIKNPDTQLNANYPFVMRRAALSNWTHMIPHEFQQGAARWGYTMQFTRVLDAGGTVFSDALLGITETLSMLEQPEELYFSLRSKVVEQDNAEFEYTLYQNRYQLPFGITVSDFDIDMTKPQATPFDLQNSVFHLLAPEQEWDLIEIVSEGDGEADSHQTIEVNGEQALYFAGSVWDQDCENMTIYVNGKEVVVPTVGEPDNTGYPAYFNNNMLLLGVFCDEEVTVDVEYVQDKQTDEKEMSEKFTIGALDLQLLQELCEDEMTRKSVDEIVTDKNTMSLCVNAEKGQKYVLLPIGWDKGFSMLCNGKTVDSHRAFGIFTAIPIEEGTNKIVITFVPAGMKIGIIISMITLLLLNVVWMISLKKSDKSRTVALITDGSTWYAKMMYIAFFGVWCTMVMIIYVIPILFIPITFFI